MLKLHTASACTTETELAAALLEHGSGQGIRRLQASHVSTATTQRKKGPMRWQKLRARLLLGIERRGAHRGVQLGVQAFVLALKSRREWEDYARCPEREKRHHD